MKTGSSNKSLLRPPSSYIDIFKTDKLIQFPTHLNYVPLLLERKTVHNKPQADKNHSNSHTKSINNVAPGN